ncbi:MAG: hypothetical protein LC118_20620 [Dehalococcoidia bacterium]|nr:hypothetical protein [Dehalococcoidia bacterium]
MTRRDAVAILLGIVFGFAASAANYWVVFNDGYSQGWTESVEREVIRCEEQRVAQCQACEDIREYVERWEALDLLESQ